jgi:uncharacterized protein
VFGVGITYSAAIEPLLDRCPDLFDVVEVEPQTLWIRAGRGTPRFRVEEAVVAHLERLPGRKLIHSVGTPVGGTVPPEAAQLELLAEMVARFEAPWLSDHLSYNQTPEFATGFFLPPRQTQAGVEAVTRSISILQQALQVPILVETGVNYLRPRPDEMPDGQFVAAVVERAECGLLLDMHNVFTNALNGRQPVDEFIDALPLERVREIHLAGGVELDGFWLDAHSGELPEPLVAICERLIPRLPSLDAIIFEIFPSFVPLVGLDVVQAQIERLHELWRYRGTVPEPTRKPRALRLESSSEEHALPPEAWERALGSLVIGRNDAAAEDGLRDDPAISLVQGLIHEFRASMIVGVLRLTSRLLMLALGTDAFRTILASYWLATPPQMYASLEADAFARHLEQLDLRVPHLTEVLRFEQAVMATLADGRTRVVAFEFEPLPLLRSLAEGRLLDEPPQAGRFEIELTADGPTAAGGVDEEALRAAYPYH